MKPIDCNVNRFDRFQLTFVRDQQVEFYTTAWDDCDFFRMDPYKTIYLWVFCFFHQNIVQIGLIVVEIDKFYGRFNSLDCQYFIVRWEFYWTYWTLVLHTKSNGFGLGGSFYGYSGRTTGPNSKHLENTKINDFEKLIKVWGWLIINTWRFESSKNTLVKLLTGSKRIGFTPNSI